MLRMVGMLVVAVVVAIGLLSAPQLLGLACLSGLVLAVGTYSALQKSSNGSAGRSRRTSNRGLAALTGIATAGAYFGIAGLVLLLGSVTVPLLLAAAIGVASHLVLRTRRERTSDGPAGTPVVPPAGTAESTLLVPANAATMSATELCRAWRVSHLMLRSARTPSELHQVAVRRGHLLDELARRDPDGFHRWIHGGARADSDPAHYIRGACGSTIDGEPAG